MQHVTFFAINILFRPLGKAIWTKLKRFKMWGGSLINRSVILQILSQKVAGTSQAILAILHIY